MSSFVPLQKSSPFHAGVLGPGETGPVSEELPEQAQEAVEAGSEADAEVEGIRLPQTEEELEALLMEAREQARTDAEAALVSIRESLQNEQSRVERLCERMDAARTSWGNEVRNVLGELVVVGVRQVVNESADLQADLIRDRLSEVGERLLGEQHVILRVRPEDEALARTMIGDREGWQILPDSDLSGGVLAETEGGKVDATLGAAITGLAEAVQGWQDEGVGEE